MLKKFTKILSSFIDVYSRVGRYRYRYHTVPTYLRNQYRHLGYVALEVTVLYLYRYGTYLVTVPYRRYRYRTYLPPKLPDLTVAVYNRHGQKRFGATSTHSIVNSQYYGLIQPHPL